MFEYPDLIIMLDHVEAKMQLKSNRIESQHYNWGVRNTIKKIKELLT